MTSGLYPFPAAPVEVPKAANKRIPGGIAKLIPISISGDEVVLLEVQAAAVNSRNRNVLAAVLVVPGVKAPVVVCRKMRMTVAAGDPIALQITFDEPTVNRIGLKDRCDVGTGTVLGRVRAGTNNRSSTLEVRQPGIDRVSICGHAE